MTTTKDKAKDKDERPLIETAMRRSGDQAALSLVRCPVAILRTRQALPTRGGSVKKADRLRAECRQRAEVALANVGAAQQSTREMRKAPDDVVAFLNTAQSALRSAMAELAKAGEP